MKLQDLNNRYLFSILLVLLFNLSGNICSAQYQQPFFDHITTQDGLSQSTVNQIIQDDDGFLWFATNNGLNKYDGYSFKVYQKNTKDKTSISSNDVFGLFKDNKGYLWILNGNDGLDRFDPKTETFENFIHDPANPESISSNDIYQVTQDSKGNIWICAGNALNLFVPPDKSKNKRARFVKYMNPDSSSTINWIFENSKGQLLVFSDYLYNFDPITKKMVNTGVRIDNPAVTSIIEDSQGNMLISTVLTGIKKLEYNKITNTYRMADPGKLNVAPNQRTRFCLDHNNHIWLATEVNGLYLYKPETDELENFRHDEFDNNTISDNTIYSLCEDNTGVLWIGTFSNGLDKYDFYRKQFQHFRKIPNKKNSLNKNVVSSIHGIDPNELWVGLDVGGGVDRILFTGNQEPRFIHYLNNPKDQNTIGTSSALCLVQRKNGEVWVGCAGGMISKIRPETPFTGRKPVIKNYQFVRWTFAIYEDSDDILWGGTWDGGIWRYDDKTDKFDFFQADTSKKYSLGDNIIWSIGEDRHKNIWIGGHGKGISVLTADEKKKLSPKFIQFSLEKNNPKSLSNNTINAFCQAQDGNFLDLYSKRPE